MKTYQNQGAEKNIEYMQKTLHQIEGTRIFAKVLFVLFMGVAIFGLLCAL